MVSPDTKVRSFTHRLQDFSGKGNRFTIAPQNPTPADPQDPETPALVPALFLTGPETRKLHIKLGPEQETQNLWQNPDQKIRAPDRNPEQKTRTETPGKA
jgi:hypothetical protein